MLEVVMPTASLVRSLMICTELNKFANPVRVIESECGGYADLNRSSLKPSTSFRKSAGSGGPEKQSANEGRATHKAHALSEVGWPATASALQQLCC